MWSSPIPPDELAASLAVGRLLGPIAAIAFASVVTGFVVMLAGLVEEWRAGRATSTPGTLPPARRVHTRAAHRPA